MEKSQPTGFSDLPQELRWHIWKLCILEERILPFRASRGTAHANHNIHSFHALPPPNLLFVCKESREETMRYFRQGSWSIKQDKANDGVIAGNSGGWWNPSMDIIHVPYWLPSAGLPPGTSSASTTHAKLSDMNFVFVDARFQSQMNAIEHFACSMKSTSIRWAWADNAKNGVPWNWHGIARWLYEFPYLKTFTWIVDYTTYRYNREGPRWVDYPDFPIEGIWRWLEARWDMTPSKIQEGFQESFEVVKLEKHDPDWKPPQVRIVMNEEDFEKASRCEERYRRKHPVPVSDTVPAEYGNGNDVETT